MGIDGYVHQFVIPGSNALVTCYQIYIPSMVPQLILTWANSMGLTSEKNDTLPCLLKTLIKGKQFCLHAARIAIGLFPTQATMQQMCENPKEASRPKHQITGIAFSQSTASNEK